jgi:ABC-2 type transport system permease protein
MHWSKILLVIKREYLTRVKSKVFIISTLLIPLGFIAYIALIIGIQYWESEPRQDIAVHDQTSVLAERLIQLNSDRYQNMSDVSIDSVRSLVLTGNMDGYIILTDEHITGQMTPEFIYQGSSSMALQTSIRSDLRDIIREERLVRAEVTDDVRSIFDSRVALNSRKLTETGDEEEDHAAFYSALGFILGLIIFFSLFMYGTIIMRGVIEEKSNRIIEVIASSIKPIELLTGKILGITSVALTQFLIWTGLLFLISLAASPLAVMLAGDISTDPASMDAIEGFDPASFAIPAVPPSLVLLFFIFFILGYFLYSALFASIGSAVDSESDTQQLMMPVFILLFIGFFLNVEIIQNPDSAISVFGSLFPFFAPMNMITRLAISSVPIWQIALSILLMAATIAGTMLLSARIYRVGILQYGGKAGFKDLLKWFRQS